MLGCAGKALASRRPFVTHFTALLAPENALVAQVAQTLAQRLEVVEPSVIDFEMVAAQDHLMLVVIEDTALELAKVWNDFLEYSCASAVTHADVTGLAVEMPPFTTEKFCQAVLLSAALSFASCSLESVVFSTRGL